MTVKEAGAKGGKTTLQKHGTEHFQKMGKKGGNRIKELIEKGKQVEAACSTTS